LNGKSTSKFVVRKQDSPVDGSFENFFLKPESLIELHSPSTLTHTHSQPRLGVATELNPLLWLETPLTAKFSSLALFIVTPHEINSFNRIFVRALCGKNLIKVENFID
jgi:hypothetical protein